MLYVFTSIVGFSAIGYVPDKLIVHGNAAATANDVVASECCFDCGSRANSSARPVLFSSPWLCTSCSKASADDSVSLMMLLIVVSVPIVLVNELNSIAALVLVHGADFLSIFDKPQREALAMLFLNLHDHGFVVVEIFWGLWLFPLGLLVYRSRFLPRFLGVWLGLAGFAWVVLSLTGILLPEYQHQVYTLLSARLPRGDCFHAVASDQGRQAASAGRGSVIVGGWLGGIAAVDNPGVRLLTTRLLGTDPLPIAHGSIADRDVTMSSDSTAVVVSAEVWCAVLAIGQEGVAVLEEAHGPSIFLPSQ